MHHVGERVACVIRVRRVRTKPISSGGVVGGKNADVTGIVLEVETSFDGVVLLDPGQVVGDVGQLISAMERPAAIEAEAWRGRCALSRGLCSIGSKTNVGKNVEVIGVKESRKRDWLAIGSF